jgi:hypothetical protein
MGILILGLTLGMTCKKKNQPPGAPSIPSGPTSGRKGDSLRFSTLAEDPDGDSVAVRFDWGDSTMSDWSALVQSGDSVVMTHAWQRLAAYPIRAQARDTGEKASAWSGEHQLTIASFSVTFGGSGDNWGYSVQQTSDGGYVVMGSTSSYGAGNLDVWLVKTDASGNKVWDKTLGGIDYEEGNWVQQTSDGGYIIAGWTDSYGAGHEDVWLVKTDASGNRVWDKTFGGVSWDEGFSVQQTSDGGYIVVGLTTPESDGGFADAWLIRTDALGNKVWDRTFGWILNDYGYSVQQTSDGGYVILGVTEDNGSGGHGIWLIKTDTSGNKVWDKTFGETSLDEGRQVQQTSDGGYIITGTAGGHNVWLIRTDADGNEVWDRTFGGTREDNGYSGQRTSDGGYVVAGYTYSFGAGYDDVWLIKTDSSGNEVWDKTFGGPNRERGQSVRQTSDGGYIITGYTASFGAGGYDIWLVKTDADGN